MDHSSKSDIAVFEAVNFGFEYPNGKQALKNLSFRIYPGDFVLVCGQSGSGKTTLLRELKNISPRGKTSGDLYFCGKSIKEVGTRLISEVGFVFQSPDEQIVCDHVFAELAFGLENLGIFSDEIRRRIAEVSAFFGMEQIMERETYTLSGGQKQMMNLASVMAMHPSVLLLDEPTSQLDPVHSSEFLGILTRLNRELGMTIVISEHSLEEVYPLADKVMLMDSGRLICFDQPRKTADYIFNIDHKMKHALPSAARIAYNINPQYAQIPLNVKEGREFLKSAVSLHDSPSKNKVISSKPPLLKIKNLFFRYKKTLPDVLNNLSFQGRAGEIICLFGGNGEGKTTFLQLICRVLKPYRGKILFDEKPIERHQSVYMPQNPLSMFIKDSIREDLELFGKAQGIQSSEIESIIRKYRFFEGVPSLMEQHPMDVSGGELQRIAFLKIKLLGPKIILLDEPTKGLDSFAKYDLAQMLKELSNEGACIIAATHDIEFAAETAHKCAMIFGGEIVSKGAPSEFFAANHFYTTAANKICRHLLPGVVTVKDVTDYANK